MEGSLGRAPPGGADFQAIVSALLALEGEDATAAWLDGMKENATVYQNNIATMKAVNAGEVPGGVIYHYYWFRDQDGTGENSGNTELHYFGNQDPGAFVSVSGGGVLKSSTHQDEAQQFLAFIAGAAGQTILGEGYSFEYPVGERRAGEAAAARARHPRRAGHRPVDAERPRGHRPDDGGRAALTLTSIARRRRDAGRRRRGHTRDRPSWRSSRSCAALLRRRGMLIPVGYVVAAVLRDRLGRPAPLDLPASGR